MAVEIGALRALLSLNSAAFEKGAKRAEASMSGLQKSLSRTAKKMGSIGKKMTTRMTLPLAGIASVAVKTSMSTIDAQSKMAQSLNTSTRSMQVLQRAADRAGLSAGELQQVSMQLTKRLSQVAATGKGPAADALKRLGLNAQDLSKLDLDQKIEVINRAIADTVPVAEQAAVAAALFGDRAGLLAGRLDAATIAAANEELERLGVTVTEIEADKIEEANDAISGLGLVARGLGNQLAVALAPTLLDIANRMADLGAWFNNLSPQMKKFVGIAAAVAAAIGPVAIGLGFVATGMAALASPVGLVVLGLGAIVGVAAAVAANWDTLVERFPALGVAAERVGDAFDVWSSGVQEYMGLVSDAVRSAVSGVIDLFQGDFAGAFENFKASWQSAGEAIRVSVDSWIGIIDAIIPGFREWADNIVSTVTELPGKLYDHGAQAIQRFADGIRDKWAEVKESVLSIFRLDGMIKGSALDEGGPLAQMRGVGRDLVQGQANGMLDAADAVKDAARTVTQGAEDAARDVSETHSPSQVWMRIGRDLMDGLSVGIGENAAKAVEAAGRAASSVTQRAGDVMSEGARRISGVLDEIGQGFSGAIMQGEDFGERMRGVFQQIAADFVSSNISNLLGNIFGMGGGGGGLLSGLFAGFFDGGGRIPSGQIGIAGEFGPEIVEGPARVTSRADTAKMFGGGSGGDVTLHQTFSFAANGDESVKRLIAEAAPAIGNMTIDMLMDARGRGGAVRNVFKG
ncbi:hypothetical protein [Roseovarius pacificus]|uniref:hypothetical protein n=1 Tax=Roseovarius pacificus TaxID=337701 RepID=UPI002A18C08D|nr:hypothetical protein [Roseovarius pacificus]